ncbi:hypothetical protein AVEN_168144-1, partial [Araneus ventricosus]
MSTFQWTNESVLTKLIFIPDVQVGERPGLGSDHGPVPGDGGPLGLPGQRHHHAAHVGSGHQ